MDHSKKKYQLYQGEKKQTSILNTPNTSSTPSTPSTSSNSILISKTRFTKTQLDEYNGNDILYNIEDHFSSNDQNFANDISENDAINSNSK
ncbi:34207_t:CDS:2 [Racocetra persica]|uniref:34207_t:CDS:1 n=1 Tax=Racocetra persica TaxID=160502 RepID=A0ACA9KL71_9GLOM|nr:34207_t:CDS:2 [Racocetra persica]